METAATAGVIILIYGVIFLAITAGTIFWIVELIDVLRREFADTMTKLIWVLVILFGHFIGSIIYYFVGRPQGRLPGAAQRLY